MATKGQVLTDPASGLSIEFITTSAETNGEYVTLKYTIKSKGKYAPNHLHPQQDEHFEVLSGELACLINGEEKIFRAGESILMPRNQPHNHYNPSDVPLVMLQTVTPALDFEILVESLLGLLSDGKVKNGQPELLQNLVMLKYLDSKVYLADVPIGVQNMLTTVLAPIARQFGYRAAYKKYSGVEK